MNELEETLYGLPCRKIHVQLFIGFILISLEHFSNGLTNPDDVAAINSLYVALGSPMIPGWVPNGGDPCAEAWQGVQCDTSNNIVSIILVDASLGGGLGDSLGSFSSIKLMDFSNNHIGGSIPTSFPVSITHFFLSDNNFTGSIPDSLSSLTQLSGLKINENRLSGELPDSFQSLTNLAILDLADNSLSGKLPPSMEGLSALTSLHLQSNQLSGTLDSLQDLPLQDLDISDNQFNGPIPEKLLSIPTFKKDGNPFNISPLPSPAPPSTGFFPSSPPTPSSAPPHSGTTPSGSTPPGTTPSGPTPPGTTPSGPTPTPPETTPSGSTPPGTTPSGPTPTPPGTTPSGSKPPGTTPSGSTPTPPGTTSSGSKPPGTTPSGSTPSGTTPSGSTSPGTIPSGSTSGPHRKQASSPSAQDDSRSGSNKKHTRTTRIAGIVVGSLIGFIVLTLMLMLCVPMGIRRSKEFYRTSKRHEIEPYEAPPTRPVPSNNSSLVQPNTQIEKAAVAAPKQEPHTETRRTAAIPKKESDLGLYSQRRGLIHKKDSELSMSDIDLMVPPPPRPPPPPPPPQPLPLAQKVMVNPITSREAPVARPPPKVLQTSVRSFKIAYLQEYTNSFSQENLIGSGMLGSVYRAEAPGGKLLAVKKLDRGVCSRQKEHEFIELVNNIDKIRHANVVELVGYCSEHGHRLLVYEYCGNGTLQDALLSDDEYRKKLSWNTRMQMAIGAARALEYLHEVCEPPIIHRNFKSGNILLDDDLSVRVSDCGLAPLIGSGSVSQLSGHLLSTYGYGAPEFETGIYTQKSDVYSFGVIMLELLTGRMSYDRARTRGEQILVRWAVPQLHDIDALQGMVDPCLIGEYPAKFLSRFADIIFKCVQAEPEFRPQMSEVVQDLQRILRRG